MAQGREVLAEAGLGVLAETPIETHIRALAAGPRIDVLALGVCLVRYDETRQTFLDLLRRAASGGALAEDETHLNFIGLHILAANRQTDAFPLLLRLLALDEDDLDRLLGDGLTATMQRVAASLFDGDADALMAAIMDSSRNEYARNSLLEAATYLTWQGRIDREAMRRLLVRFDDEGLAADYSIEWLGWLSAIALLGFEDLAPRVRQAWNSARIDETLMDLEDFEGDLAWALRAPEDTDRFKLDQLGLIDDVYEAISWADHDDEDDVLDDDESDGFDDEDGLGMAPWLSEPGQPVSNPFRHVGRNDPCPCGSGKKAKKCCLG
jgi:hypothetical protein